MIPKLEFTKNEAIAMMHQDKAFSLRAIADWIEKHKPDPEYIVQMMREIADEQDAQAIVVRLRDEL